MQESFTLSYIIYFTFINPELNSVEHWWFGISPEGIGTLGMIINFTVALGVAKFTKAPPAEIQELVENIRIPRQAVKSKQDNKEDSRPVVETNWGS